MSRETCQQIKEKKDSHLGGCITLQYGRKQYLVLCTNELHWTETNSRQTDRRRWSDAWDNVPVHAVRVTGVDLLYG